MERNSLYENVPDRRNDELLGILKTLDGSAIFCDSVLCRRASRVVCTANQIKMAAPERSIRQGKALRIPIIAEGETVSLRREEFSFINTNCLFYIIDSRPQKPGMDVKLLPNRHSFDRLSSRFVPESAREEIVPNEGPCQCAEFVRLVEKNSKDVTILVIVLCCVLITVAVAFVVALVHWSTDSQNSIDEFTQENVHIKTNITCDDAHEDRDDNVTEITREKPPDTSLQQLYEKQQRELSTPKLACGLTYATKLAAEILEPDDDLMYRMDLTQQVALARCPSEAFCPALHECAPVRYVRKQVAVRIAQNDSHVEELLFAARETEEAGDCSCQPASFVEYVTEDVDIDEVFGLENRTRRDVRRDVSLPQPNSSEDIGSCRFLISILLLVVGIR